jgi:hypothetical protein
MVFAPEAAPEGREAFMGWFRKITKSGEEHDYDDAACTSPKLRDWYGDMVSVFPAMNGPNGVADDHPSHASGDVTDYTCARDAIYVGFSWNVAEEAYDHALTYAAIHKVGFFESALLTVQYGYQAGAATASYTGAPLQIETESAR